jgi:uncharacterized membrane protein YfcA
METQGLLFLVGIAALSFALSFYGAAVGLILGHLRLPLLIYYLPSTTAGMATNLAISGLGAFTGSARHARAGRVSWPMVALMGVPSLIGAAAGGLLLVQLEASLSRMFIGAFLLFTGASLFRPPSDEPGAAPAALRGGRVVLEVVIGLALGLLASLTGLMLGSLRLPAMIRLLRIDPAIAVGTNMVIGCVTALCGAVSLWPYGEAIPLLPLFVVVPPTILGGYLGARFTDRFRKETLHRLIGTTIVLTGVGMFAEGAWRFGLA